MLKNSPDHRAQVKSGICPICHKGCFTNILQHICRAHHIPARVAREQLGFTFSESICSPELSQLRHDQQEGTPSPRLKGNPDYTARVYSTEGARRRNAALTNRGYFATLPKDQLRRIAQKGAKTRNAKRLTQ